MLLQDRPATTAADALQGRCWCEWLVRERAELARELSKHKRCYEHCVALLGVGRLSYLRSTIRELERDIRTIDHMIDALERRFSGQLQMPRRV